VPHGQSEKRRKKRGIEEKSWQIDQEVEEAQENAADESAGLVVQFWR
jgi:hypothetical protein